MNISYRKANEDDRLDLAACIAEGFSKDFRLLINNRDKIVDFLSKSINPSKFYLCLVGQDLAGCLAVSEESSRAAKASKESLNRNFNFFKSWVSYKILKNEFERSLYLDDGCGFIEFVTIRPSYMAKGLSTKLLNFAMDQPKYKSFVLDVNDKNYKAIGLYKKLGFEEIYRKKERFSLIRGYKERIYMKKDKIK